MKHLENRWNPDLQEWFCISCGRTSDHVVYEDAQAEMELFKCELPAAEVYLERAWVRRLWVLE